MTDLTPIHFYDERIEVLFNEPPVREKAPHCPNGFIWNNITYRITTALSEWTDFTRRGKMANNMRPAHAAAASTRGSLNVGRYYFRVQVESGQVFDLYYDRAMKNVDDRKGQWFVYRELEKENGSNTAGNNTNGTPPPSAPFDPAPPSGTSQDKPKPASWTANDTWLGLGLLVILVLGYIFALALLEPSQTVSILYVATFEFILLIPIAVILFWRKISWKELGLRSFNRNALALGCGLLVAVYVLVIINNLIMVALGIITQADVISDLLGEIDAPLLFAFVTAIVAPFTEELFFRGFLFKGLREKYGWVNALMFSSIIFALFHGQIATLIPTFLLGALFAYIYQRTDSVFPGMILHFMVNAMGALVLLFANQMGAL